MRRRVRHRIEALFIGFDEGSTQLGKLARHRLEILVAPVQFVEAGRLDWVSYAGLR